MQKNNCVFKANEFTIFLNDKTSIKNNFEKVY